jgi:8-oxo-dGTP pyrophosphatase MutT (NUDIX family)
VSAPPAPLLTPAQALRGVLSEMLHAALSAQGDEGGRLPDDAVHHIDAVADLADDPEALAHELNGGGPAPAPARTLALADGEPLPTQDPVKAAKAAAQAVVDAAAMRLGKVLATPGVANLFPYRAYHAIHDDRVRPDHLALEKAGIGGSNIFRTDDPVWEIFRPPWGYNCRCSWSPISIRDAADLGVDEARLWLSTGEPPAHPAHVRMPSFQPDGSYERTVSLSTSESERESKDGEVIAAMQNHVELALERLAAAKALAVTLSVGVEEGADKERLRKLLRRVASRARKLLAQLDGPVLDEEGVELALASGHKYGKGKGGHTPPGQGWTLVGTGKRGGKIWAPPAAVAPPPAPAPAIQPPVPVKPPTKAAQAKAASAAKASTVAQAQTDVGAAVARLQAKAPLTAAELTALASDLKHLSGADLAAHSTALGITKTGPKAAQVARLLAHAQGVVAPAPAPPAPPPAPPAPAPRPAKAPKGPTPLQQAKAQALTDAHAVAAKLSANAPITTNDVTLLGNALQKLTVAQVQAVSAAAGVSQYSQPNKAGHVNRLLSFASAMVPPAPPPLPPPAPAPVPPAPAPTGTGPAPPVPAPPLTWAQRQAAWAAAQATAVVPPAPPLSAPVPAPAAPAAAPAPPVPPAPGFWARIFGGGVKAPASPTAPGAPTPVPGASAVPQAAPGTKDEVWKTGDPRPGTSLNGIPFTSAPKKFWEKVKDVDGIEPPALKKIDRAGVMIVEPDGRVWIVQPTNGFGGRNHTLPGGGVEKGLTDQQNALKEVWEETGLQVEITGHLGDFEDSNNGNNGRMYVGRRIGGAPWDAKIESFIIDKKTGKPAAESETVTLATPESAAKLLHRSDDLAQLMAVAPISLDTPVSGKGSDPLKKLVAALQPKALDFVARAKAVGNWSPGNGDLHAAQELRGFNGKPKVATQQDFDALVAKGDHIEMLRGISGHTADALAEQFRSGANFPGHGCFGAGTYCDSNKGGNNQASTYAAQSGGTGALLRIALPKTAKIIKQSDLERMVPREPADSLTYGHHPRNQEWWGVQATLAGYDAIEVDGKSKQHGSYGTGYYVVLNRSVAIVQDKNAPQGYKIP